MYFGVGKHVIFMGQIIAYLLISQGTRGSGGETKWMGVGACLIFARSIALKRKNRD